MIAVMSLDLFSGLSRTRCHFSEGDGVFYREATVERLHDVTVGTIRLLRRQQDGQSVVLQRAVPGDILAEASLLSARDPRAAGVRKPSVDQCENS